MCSEKTHRRILESDIFCILESEGVTEVGALYKVSPSKFVLVFRSKKAKRNFKVQRSNAVLTIRKSVSISINELVLSEMGDSLSLWPFSFLISLVTTQWGSPFSNFGEVVSVFKGRHNFNRKIQNGKKHVKILPAGGDPAILPKKISFHGRIKRDVLFAEKGISCYRCKTRHVLIDGVTVYKYSPKISTPGVLIS